MVRQNLHQLLKHPLLARSSRKGFTIIEVMIVLAIAGLILLIVFLAVPALQRNQRNTARKKDVSRVADAVIEYVYNNLGAPLVAADAGVGGASPTKITALVGTLSQYTLTNTTGSAALGAGAGTAGITFEVYPGNTAQAAIVNLTDIRVNYGWKCSTAGAVTQTGATTKQIAIQYASETPGTPSPLCVDF